MAVIDAYALVGPSTKIPPSVEFSAQLSAFGVVDNTPPVQQYDQGDTGYGAITNNLPIEEVEQNFTGYKAPSFLDDYYYRVHILPGILPLGNLLSAQVRNVEVWSAHFEPKLLSSVTQVGTDGITLTQPQSTPTYFAALESRIYTLSVSTNGPPIVDAIYTFNFPGESPTLEITGRRVVLWPFVPDTGYDETMSWKTDILDSYNNEQRLALRAAPRQAFSHKFLLDEAQFSRAKAISTQWAHRVYGIAVWAEVTPLLNGLTAGSTFIAFDTANADYREDDLILLWASDTQLTALEITTVQADGVNLKLPLEANWPKCYVAPLRFARTFSGIEYKRSSNRYITASGVFEVTQNKDLGDNGAYPLYRGKPVLTDRSAVVSDLSERIARTIDIFDNGSGPIQVDTAANWARHMQTIGFIKNTRAGVWALRKWIHARRGKQRAFWLPSWNTDLIILEDVASTASAITVSPIGYPLYYGAKDIMVQLKNGNRVFVRITSGSTNGDGNEVLTLSAAIGVTFAKTDIDFVCFMSHARFDSDQVVFSHKDVGQVAATIAIAETPES